MGHTQPFLGVENNTGRSNGGLRVRHLPPTNAHSSGLYVLDAAGARRPAASPASLPPLYVRHFLACRRLPHRLLYFFLVANLALYRCMLARTALRVRAARQHTLS